MALTCNEPPVSAQRMALGTGFVAAKKSSWSFGDAFSAAKRIITNQAGYRVLVSIGMGLVGFGVNFQSISFDFPPFEVKLYFGLIFPMVVALAWGWKYGLISATLGLGCQTLWFTMLPQNGLVPFIIVPALTLWIVWHGWCSEYLTKRRFPRLNPYLTEIPFRLVNTAALYTLLYSVLRWQPPPWVLQEAAEAQLFDMIHFLAAEQAVNGYIVLLVADILLNLGPTRRLLRLKQYPGRRTTGYVISAALLFGLMFWIIDGLVDYYKFREHLRFLIFRSPENLLDSILFNVASPDLFARTAFIFTCLTGGVLVNRLLNKQLESEAALRESEIRYRRLHETMWDAFLQTDMTGRIVNTNPAFQQMIGHDGKQLLAMKETDLTPVKWRAADSHIREVQVVANGGSEVYEKEYARADGSTFAAELRTFLMTDEENTPIGMWSIVRDITERKKTELERENAITALKRSNEDLKQFAYVASHDLQEPLRMVASYTQLLAERYEEQLDEKAHRYIHYAVDGASRMQVLIQDLLAFSRVETHAQTFEQVDTHCALGHAIVNLKTIIDETGALVTTDDLPTVQSDQFQLIQVFQNLIGNGIKFCSKHAVPHIHISAQRQNGHYRFSVKDNGIGIDSKYKDRVFEIFQRLHTRKAYPGTGIGLALCKRIIERHGGRIWFESAPGHGTTFYFTIPVNPPRSFNRSAPRKDFVHGNAKDGKTH